MAFFENDIFLSDLMMDTDVKPQLVAAELPTMAVCEPEEDACVVPQAPQAPAPTKKSSPRVVVVTNERETSNAIATQARRTRRRKFKYVPLPTSEDDEDDGNVSSSSGSSNHKQQQQRKVAAASVDIDPENMSPEELEVAKAEKSRQSARDCRLRKKKYLQSLEKKLGEMETRLTAVNKQQTLLQERNSVLQAENERLRRLLALGAALEPPQPQFGDQFAVSPSTKQSPTFNMILQAFLE
jgi:hypothetical protein